MSIVNLKNYTCNYLFEDNGKDVTIVFSNSLGTNLSMWDENMPFLNRYFNILRHDTRGHGHSSINGAEVTVGELAEDIIELLDYLKLDQVVFCGLSIGGLIGQHLGIYHPNRFQKIILSNTAAKIGTETGWNTRIEQVAKNGLNSILDGTADRWFTPKYRVQFPEKVTEILNAFAANSLNGYIAGCTAVRDADFTNDLHKIPVPVLIISGTQDEVTTVVHGDFLQQQIPDAQHVQLEAAHLSNKEHPHSFSDYIIQFLK